MENVPESDRIHQTSARVSYLIVTSIECTAIHPHSAHAMRMRTSVHNKAHRRCNYVGRGKAPTKQIIGQHHTTIIILPVVGLEEFGINSRCPKCKTANKLNSARRRPPEMARTVSHTHITAPQASFGDISTFNGLMRACTIKNESAHAQHHFTTRNMSAQTHAHRM